MDEYLSVAENNANELRAQLLLALNKSSAVEALLIIRIITDFAPVATMISELRDAVTGDHPITTRKSVKED